VCSGGHCGMPTVDAGNCSLDPGGTPCSQCVVGNCCSQTEQCLADFTCAGDMPCFQRCAITGASPAQCKTDCCGTNATCNAWTQCVIDSCAASCF
jgi:hypothetical protein